MTNLACDALLFPFSEGARGIGGHLAPSARAPFCIRFLFANMLQCPSVRSTGEVYMDFSLLFAYSWARRRFRDEFTSTVRDSLPHPWLHHAEFVGEGDYFSARIPTSSPDSPVSVDGPGLPWGDAHQIRAFPWCNAHCDSPLYSHQTLLPRYLRTSLATKRRG